MTRTFALLGFALILSASAHAACGGGGYKPAAVPTTTMSTPSAPINAPVTTQYRSSGPAVSYNSNNSFDTTQFNNISGRLHLSYDQASRIIATMNDVRQKSAAAPDKNYDAKKDFDARLAQILDPQQYKDYLASR